MPKGVYKRTKKQLERLRELARRPRTTRGGGYYAIHKWLFKNYGKADRCEGRECKKISHTFHWCLLKGKKYEHKRENFIMFCSSCHRLYDQTKEWIKRARDNRHYKILTEEHKKKISESMKLYKKYGTSKTSN